MKMEAVNVLDEGARPHLEVRIIWDKDSCLILNLLYSRRFCVQVGANTLGESTA